MISRERDDEAALLKAEGFMSVPPLVKQLLGDLFDPDSKNELAVLAAGKYAMTYVTDSTGAWWMAASAREMPGFAELPREELGTEFEAVFETTMTTIFGKPSSRH